MYNKHEYQSQSVSKHQKVEIVITNLGITVFSLNVSNYEQNGLNRERSYNMGSFWL